MSGAILLTGATGFVGGELLPRLLAARPDARVICLMRARKAPVEVRRRELLDWAGVSREDWERVVALEGTLLADDLGLGEGRAELARDVDEIFHSAASTRFDLPLDVARDANCSGLARLLAFASEAQARGGLRRLHHVSTAYAEGRPGTGEDEAGRFRNSYEQSKWEGEQLLLGSEVPTTCYCPSIIVGDSKTGRTRHFRVLYDPIKWVYLAGLDALPCRPKVRLDVVPIDYVCDALIAIAAREDSAGRTYRLTGGERAAISIEEFARLAILHGNEWQAEVGEELTPMPDLISPEQLEHTTGDERKGLEAIFAATDQVASDHLPYMLEEQLFPSPETDEALAGTGITCPPLRDYMRPLIRYGSVERYGAKG
jgi:thioester reductase-like protein